MTSKTWRVVGSCLLCFVFLLSIASNTHGQAITATLNGRIVDSSGGTVAKASITITNKETGISRTVQSSTTGEYNIPALPAGDYTVKVEFAKFNKETRNITLQVGQTAELDFTLSLEGTGERVNVEATSELQEPTRTQVSTVITERQINNLPVNGREFIDFALLSPSVVIGDTTSGSTDVIVEPVTKLSFAGQNIHYNFIAVDGADDISTASGIQRGTPPQESVREFRVINSDYSTEFGRAVGGIVNIITRGGTNELHGILYEYFRNNVLDAINPLQATGAHVLRQNQFGVAIGGPIQKDKTFFFANYEAQRRAESPFYNSAVLTNIKQINIFKANFGLPAEPNLSSVLRTNNSDNGFIRLDHTLNDKESLYVRYFINDGRLTNQSPLNDGFDLPSAFKNNFYRDQSLAGSLVSVINANNVNELRMQYARRSFGFPTVTTQPHLEVSNIFTVGVNRGNPDSYLESRFEIVDNFSHSFGKHTLSFGGNYNFVSTTESFPLFYPFEADFSCIFTAQCASSLQAGAPSVIFFERFQAPNFTEPTFNTSVFLGSSFTPAIHNQAQGNLHHTYDGLFIEDKWRATNHLTLNAGLRWEWETWPSNVLDTQWKDFDPRVGLAYGIGGKHNFVVRAGFGLFHGMIPAPLLACQIPSCGGTGGKFPGRPNEDNLNSNTRLFAFASAPNITSIALADMLAGKYPDAAPLGFCPGGVVAGCGFFGDATVVRFAQNHKNPLGLQASLAIEFEPLPDTAVSISLLHVRGEHLGSFFNVNQPDPTFQSAVHDSQGHAGSKNLYCAVPVACPFTPGSRSAAPGFPVLYGIYFEANSFWDSVYDGFLLNVNKRLSHNFSYGLSYTFAKSIDDGPNPSFVLIPQDSKNIGAERQRSSDDVRHRLVLNGTVSTPKNWNAFGRNFLFSSIITIQSPMRFSKYAGFDANGDIFGNNDRVGVEPRNTFVGDNFRSIDFRISRTFPFQEKRSLELLAEVFNLSNTLNVKYFNTVYGAADFCKFNSAAFGCPAIPSTNLEGSPNPLYGTPRANNNPRQIQFAAKFKF